MGGLASFLGSAPTSSGASTQGGLHAASSRLKAKLTALQSDVKTYTMDPDASLKYVLVVSSCVSVYLFLFFVLFVVSLVRVVRCVMNAAYKRAQKGVFVHRERKRVCVSSTPQDVSGSNVRHVS